MLRNLLALLVALALVACVDPYDDGWKPDGPGVGDAGPACGTGQYQCSGNKVQTCKDSKFVHHQTCYSPKVCSAKLGRCVDCVPGISVCKGDAIHECTASGTAGAKLKTCPPGTCSSGLCIDPCTRAKEERSYTGCSYWPTVTSNAGLVADFSFAVAVANAWSSPAKVAVSSAGSTLSSITVAPNSLATIKLPWVDSLKGKSTGFSSVLLPGAAYHLVSSLPVTVYQFNAMNYQLPGDCTKGVDINPGDGKCFSYTNDASLLLPEHALTKEYMVLSRPTMAIKFSGQYSASPGFFSVVAPGKGKTKVSVTFSANTRAGSGGLAAYKKGQTASFTLSQWGVLQILSELPSSCTVTKTDPNGAGYCDVSATTDLTGTMIKADQAVAVFSGHDCTFVPWDKWACDHLEEQLFPTASLGKKYIATHAASSGNDPTLYRVVSASGENGIGFDPPVHNPVSLNKGQFIEFTSTQDFLVAGADRLIVVQFMVGQNYSNTTPGKGAPGDPAMALAVPLEQYRSSYRFLAPESYEKNYVNITAPTNATVALDGATIDAGKFQQVGKTAYKVAKIQISGGAHHITSKSKFGITVYGVGSYTSYMYPGGLDLKALK